MKRKIIRQNENYRLKRIARLVEGLHTVVDVGYADYHNRFFRNREVIGVDIKKGNKPVFRFRKIVFNFFCSF